MFAGRKICIATMHKKETVIAPVLEKELSLNCFVCHDLNTDLLGTFSGEVERILTPLETARQKCLNAISITGCDLAVSSEGSFGPHPVLGFVPCNEEILFLYDKRNKLELFVKELSLHTNFAANEFENFETLKPFANRHLFPSHGLIIKDVHNHVLEKGITDWATLETCFYTALKKGAPVKVETDMRAHFNPTRMNVIEACAHKLVKAIQTTCPACDLPGFVIKQAEPGLPCEQCHMPTRSTLKHLYTCSGCGYSKEEIYPHQKTHEDPTYCDFCNP